MTTVTDEATTPTRQRRRLSTTDLALVAAFGALIAVASYTAAIPVGGAGVPITLQSLAVLLAGLVLGPVRGFLAVCLYFVLGIVGLPVFAEHTSGAATFTHPSAGYLYSFAVAAAIAGFGAKYVAGRHRTHAILLFASALVATVANHIGGMIGFRAVLGMSWHEAATTDAPYWVGDLVKAAVAAIVAAEVHRAFPRLLARG